MGPGTTIEVDVKVTKRAKAILGELQHALDAVLRLGGEDATEDGDGRSSSVPHVHCGFCGSEAIPFDIVNAIGGRYGRTYECLACKARGFRDDRGCNGTIRWG